MSVQEINKNEVLSQVMQKVIDQTEKGIQKYGKTVQPDDLSDIEWADHAIEEAIDFAVYMTCWKMRIAGGKR